MAHRSEGFRAGNPNNPAATALWEAVGRGKLNAEVAQHLQEILGPEGTVGQMQGVVSHDILMAVLGAAEASSS